jgi:hypothetical protein
MKGSQLTVFAANQSHRKNHRRCYGGKGVRDVVRNVNESMALAIHGMRVDDPSRCFTSPAIRSPKVRSFWSLSASKRRPATTILCRAHGSRTAASCWGSVRSLP